MSEPPAGPLRCPHCSGALARTGASYRCAEGHSFDVARQGYVNLMVGRTRPSGDSAAMLDARATVLSAGHLELVTQALVQAARPPIPAGVAVEIGAGTAHHLARVRSTMSPRTAVAMDASVAAARRAARADDGRLLSVVADAWSSWPLLDGCAALVMSVFSPRNPAETARVLAPGGRLVVVTPAHGHLGELAGPLGLLGVEPDKAARVGAEFAAYLSPLDESEARDRLRVSREHAAAIAAMGPAAHHHDPGGFLDRASGLPEEIEVTVAVRIQRFVAA